MSQIHLPTATEFFEADAANWDAYYERRDVFSVIHQLRRSLALAWIDQLGLAVGAEVLEVGCGTGLFAIELARRGLRVTAVDAAANMLDRARFNVWRAGVRDAVSVMPGAAEHLPSAAASFDLVVALGLLPWVASADVVLAEMMRAAAPGGYLLASCDNSQRLTVLLDPRYTPGLRRARTAARRLLRRPHQPAEAGVSARRHSLRELDAMLRDLGATVQRAQSFGFGPFTVAGCELLPARASVALHRALQPLADAGMPGLCSSGTQYLVLAAAPG